MTKRASCAILLPAELPEWIQLFPAGDVEARDGRFWKNTDPAGILSAFSSWGMPLSVDYDHQSVNAIDKTSPIPAAGWITALEVRDGQVFGKVEWTTRAAEMIATKEYRYISPVFDYDKKTGVVLRITGAGLTNNPALYLQAVATNQGGNAMNELLKKLCGMLNLPPTSTPEEISAALDKAQEKLNNAAPAAAAMREMALALSLPETATAADVSTALTARIKVQPDPGQFVPRVEFERVAASLFQIQEERSAEVASRSVAEAIKAGKISPAMESWATDYCKQDPKGFAAYVEKAPAIVSNNWKLPGASPADGASGEISEDDRAVCSRLGITEEQFKKNRA